jgi:undecaprenyl-diphosphatase
MARYFFPPIFGLLFLLLALFVKIYGSFGYAPFAFVNFSFFADTWFIISASVITLAFLIYEKRRNEAVFFVILMVGGEILKQAMKFLLAIPRPSGNAVLGYAFPSGHAMSAVIFYGAIYALFFKNNYALAGAVLTAFLVGLSRIAFGVHWISDVIGGYLLGLFWLMLLLSTLRERRLFFRKA